MDFKFMRAGCWSAHLPTMLRLFSGSLSLLLLSFFPMSIPSNWTFSDLQTHPSNPVHIKIPKSDNNLKANFSTIHKICGMIFFQVWKLKWKNVHFSFVVLQVSFQHTFLFHSFSLLGFVSSSHVHSFTSTALCPLLVTSRAQQESTL